MNANAEDKLCISPLSSIEQKIKMENQTEDEKDSSTPDCKNILISEPVQEASAPAEAAELAGTTGAVETAEPAAMADATNAVNAVSVVCVANTSDVASAASSDSKSVAGRSLWVINLLPSTRAQELKQLMSQFGRVLGAKIVQSSAGSRVRCFGYITMESREVADECCRTLNNTKLDGRKIYLTKVKPEFKISVQNQKMTIQPWVGKAGQAALKPKARAATAASKPVPAARKAAAAAVLAQKKNKKVRAALCFPERRPVPHGRRAVGGASPPAEPVPPADTRKQDQLLHFHKIQQLRDQHRYQMDRLEERHCREMERAMEAERNQREEIFRLEKECRMLRIERDNLSRQKLEMMRLERERQKLEHEKLELEKQELKRERLRLEEARHSLKRSVSPYREPPYKKPYRPAAPQPPGPGAKREAGADAPKQEFGKRPGAGWPGAHHGHEPPSRAPPAPGSARPAAPFDDGDRFYSRPAKQDFGWQGKGPGKPPPKDSYYGGPAGAGPSARFKASSWAPAGGSISPWTKSGGNSWKQAEPGGGAYGFGAGFRGAPPF